MKRVLVHDFSGHPFQIDLSRTLARRGYEVLHVYCSSYTSGKGKMETEPNLSIKNIDIGEDFHRYSPVRRAYQESIYAGRFVRIAKDFDPDVIISCNDPLWSKTLIARWCSWRRIRWLFWLQDLYSVAIERELQEQRVPLAAPLGALLKRLERSLLRQAATVVPITEDFVPILREWRVPTSVAVIENWAPIDEIPLRDRDRARAALLGIPSSDVVFLYSGTLGLKHDPDILYDLAEHLGPRHGQVVVISEGLGIQRLKSRQEARELPNLHLLPFQKYEILPDVLAAADVLLVLLEEDAGLYSVPSKVLTYFCAGKPILGAMPGRNLAARNIVRAGAGIQVEPRARTEFFQAADLLSADAEMRTSLGLNARSFAEEHFDSEAIGARFEAILLETDSDDVTNKKGLYESNG